MDKVLFIVGPTAMGKSKLALQLAQKFNGVIISADSMQVYHGFDIGTAKPSKQLLAHTPHLLVNIKDMNETYSVAEFVMYARKFIKQIQSEHKLPIIVGGTGLYIQALLYGFFPGNLEHFSATRLTKIKQKLAQYSNLALWHYLASLDAAAAQKIPLSNRRRLERALVVILMTNKRFSPAKKLCQPKYNYFMVGLMAKREVIYQRINERVDKMIFEGLVKEVYNLYYQVHEFAPSFKGIGYREFLPYFQGKVTLSQVITTIKRNSRHYAKRQLTFLRNQLPVTWYNIQSTDYYKQLTLALHKWLDKDKMV